MTDTNKENPGNSNPFSTDDRSHYFDFKAFFIHILRHIGLFLFLVVLFGCAGFFITFIPSFKTYYNYSEDTSVTQSSAVTNEYPYIYTAAKVIYIPSGDSDTIMESALALFKSGTMMTSLKDEFFNEALSQEYKLRNRMVTYNYRLQSALESPYSPGDFYSVFDCYISPSYTLTPGGHNGITSFDLEKRHFLILSAASGDEELSLSMCERAAELLIKETTDLIGDFDYKLINRATDIALPSPESGLIPITSIGSVISTERPSLSLIIKSSLKSSLWGG